MLTAKPHDRVHFPVKFAAGALRVASVLVALAGIGVAVAVVNLPLLPGARGLSLPDLIAVAVAVGSGAFGLIFAVILWGFADGLVLLADVDDAQRATQRQVADLILGQRTARGPFHAEAVAEKVEKTERAQEELRATS